MLTIVGAVFLAWLILVLFFAPHIPYHTEEPVDVASDYFVRLIEASCQTTFVGGNTIEILTNGPEFYPAMLDAIRGARETVNMEVYMFRRGKAADRFIDALAGRARAGVRVTVVVDAIGSLGQFQHVVRPLREAGCRVERYQHMTWYRLARLNNRTHRELLIVDGEVAFVGGAGIADWWIEPKKDEPIWRDMAARIEGPIVAYIQGIAAENWLECRGEILTGPDTYKALTPKGSSGAFAVKSSPADRATVSRVLFQTLIEGARHRVRLGTPYFLPDRAFRQALMRAVGRGVEMTIVVPGRYTDQHLVRLASRRSYGRLLRAGVRIFEYQPGMTHLKACIVDDLWSVIGSTNCDNRSFEHNDEVNVAIRDEEVAARITRDLEADMAKSVEITLARWQRRPMWEKLVGSVAWILERQQ